MKNIHHIFVLLFSCLSFWVQAQNNEDSLAIKQKQFAQKLDSITQQKLNYPKNLLKLQWSLNRWNTPAWVLPTGHSAGTWSGNFTW